MRWTMIHLWRIFLVYSLLITIFKSMTAYTLWIGKILLRKVNLRQHEDSAFSQGIHLWNQICKAETHKFQNFSQLFSESRVEQNHLPVTLLRSASTEPSWIHKMMAFGLDMNVWDIWRMFSRVSAAMSVVTV